jgi:hypothetical protein
MLTKSPPADTLTLNPSPPKIDVFPEAVGFTTTDLYRVLALSGAFLSVGPTTSAGWSLSTSPARTPILFRSWLASLVLSSPRFPLSNLRFVGRARPVASSVFSFNDALKAYNMILTAKAVGEVVPEVLDCSRQHFVLSVT